MESRHLLSPNQYFHVTSQKDKLSPSFNKSQDVARIKKQVENAFNTFSLIFESSEFSPEEINEMFSDARFRDLLMDLLKYVPELTQAESYNKLRIAQTCLHYGLSYFQQQYKETTFFHEKINEFENLIDALNRIAQQDAEEEESLKFYKTRGKMKLPPTIAPHETLTITMCRICWEHYSAHSKDEAIKKIRHKKHCPYDKNDLDRCIEIFPPKLQYFSNTK